MRLTFEKRVEHSARLAKIEWLDSVQDLGWQTFDANDRQSMKVISIGFIIEGDKDKVVVVPHVQLDAEGLPFGMNGRLIIPRKAITNITTLVEDKANVSS